MSFWFICKAKFCLLDKIVPESGLRVGQFRLWDCVFIMHMVIKHIESLILYAFVVTYIFLHCKSWNNDIKPYIKTELTLPVLHNTKNMVTYFCWHCYLVQKKEPIVQVAAYVSGNGNMYINILTVYNNGLICEDYHNVQERCQVSII